MTTHKWSTGYGACMFCHKQIWFERNVVNKTVVFEATSCGSRCQVIVSYTMHKRCAATRWLDFLNEHPEVREIGN